jgi:hypothetical protein
MKADPNPSDSAPPPATGTADAQDYLDVLHDLIGMGQTVARAITARVTAAETDPATLPDLAVAFERTARAVRRTVLLADRLAEHRPARAARPRIAARCRILREVEDAIQRKAAGAEAEALQAELLERLDAPELDEEIDHRPTAEVIADICRDLGLEQLPGAHPWKRRTPTDITELCARAARAAMAAAAPVRPPAPTSGQAPDNVTRLKGTARVLLE